jgi:hypothetical protein
MSFLGWLGYGQTDASSTPPPSGPELTPGWEVYKNQRGEILYGNNLNRKCDFSAPVVQAPVAQAQTASVVQAQPAPQSWGQEPPYPSWYDSDQRRKAHDDWLTQNMMNNPYWNGGLKRKQSKRKRKQSRRKQSKRKQSKRKQSKRIS